MDSIACAERWIKPEVELDYESMSYDAKKCTKIVLN